MSGDSDLEDEIDVGGWNKMCKTISNVSNFGIYLHVFYKSPNIIRKVFR